MTYWLHQHYNENHSHLRSLASQSPKQEIGASQPGPDAHRWSCAIDSLALPAAVVHPFRSPAWVPGVLATLSLHLAAAGLIGHMAPNASTEPAAALMVSLVPPQAPPANPPPKPRPAAPVAPAVRSQPIPQQPQTVVTQSQAAADSAPPARAQEPAPQQAPAPAPVTVSEPRFDAAYLDNPAPTYPAMSRRIGEEGRVMLRVLVEANGRPSQIQIKTASTSPRLDQAAEEAVRRWKFVPAQRGQEPVAAWVLVPIVFNLKG